MISGVIFDVDGVLVDSYQPHLESWQQLAEENGTTMTEAQFASTFGMTSRDIISEIFGVTDSETVKAYDDRKEALYREVVRGAVPAMPGAIDLITYFHRSGIKVAIGSSGPRKNVELIIDEMHIGDRLAAWVCGADVSHGKPAPDIFLTAAKRMEVSPDRCIVIEDAPAGIEAAKRAGMRCIGLTSTHDASSIKGVDAVVETLSDVRLVIDKWTGKLAE